MTNLYTPDFGKIPPQAVDMEEAVLGAMLLSKYAVDEVCGILNSDAFYKESHQKIFKAILHLTNSGEPVDQLTVTERLRATHELESVGGPVFITQLTSKIVSAVNAEYHAHVVLQKYVQRELIRVSTEIQTRAYDDSFDLSEQLDFAENGIFNISKVNIKNEPVRIDQCIDDTLIEIGKIYNKEKELIGIPSGFVSIDRKTTGFQLGSLNLVAARPSMGKTALALTLARNIAELKNPVAVFSLEMSMSELAIRWLSSCSDYSNLRIKAAQIDYDRLCTLSNQVAELPIYIDDTSAITIFELRSKVKKLILKAGVKAVIVDYLQLMKHESKSREQEVSAISRGLKGIAKEFNIVVIALSQLNREVENRSGKRPQLSDLRESGSLEQDADMVWFLYCPDVYGYPTIDIDGTTYDSKGLMLIDCAKHRNGPIFNIPLFCNEYKTKISEDQNEFKKSNEPF